MTKSEAVEFLSQYSYEEKLLIYELILTLLQNRAHVATPAE